MFLIVLLSLFVLSAIPIYNLVSWIDSSSNYSQLNLVVGPKLFIRNLITFGGIVFLVYFQFFLAYLQFEYDDPIYFMLAVLCIILSSFWSFLKNFNHSNYYLFFLVGFYGFFNFNLMWVVFLTYLILVLLLNHHIMSLFGIIIVMFLSFYVYELKDYFFESNVMLLSLFFLKNLSGFENFFSKHSITITDQYFKR